MASGNTEDFQAKTTMEQRPSSQTQTKKKPLFGWVTLNPGIKQRSYFAALVHALVLGFFLSGVELLQQNLLVSPDYYNFTSDQAIQFNSAITFEDLLIKMIVTPLYGIMIDKIGRQKSAFIGYCTMTIALVLFPMKHYWPSTDFGWYFGARFIYSNGSAIIPIIPLIADYVDDHSKGRAIGFNVLFISIGFSLSTLAITLLNNYNLFYTCMVFAGVMFGLGNLYTLFLKPGNRYYRSKPIPDLETSQSNQIVDMNSSSRIGKRSLIKNDFKEKPWILAGLVFAFMNGTGLAITSQLLNLYVQSFGTPDGRALGSQTVFKANIASTVTSLVIGPMLDFIKPIYIAILAFAVTILGYCNVWAISDPTDLAMSFIAVGVGIGYSATQLLTNYLGFKNHRRSIRGMLFALANTVIVFGVICVSVIGGNLFRYFNRNWPFYIAGGCCGIGLIVFLYIYFNKILPKENGRNGDQQSPLLRNLSSEGYKDSESFSYKEEEEEDSQRQV